MKLSLSKRTGTEVLDNRQVIESKMTKHRIVVIGGGPGGYEAARAGVQLGAEVVLVEDNGIGGNAVLTDVVPSKTLIATAEAAQRVASAHTLGVKLSLDGKVISPKIDIDLPALNDDDQDDEKRD